MDTMTKIIEEENKQKKSRRKKIAVLIAIIAAIGIGFAACHHEQVPAGVALNYGEEEVIDNYAEGIVLPGFECLYVEANTKDVTLNLFNPQENAGTDSVSDYNLIFTLIVDGVEVYTSPEVAPGESITEAHLSSAIPTGAHELVVHIQPVRATDGVETNNANLTARLVAVEQ